MTAKELAAMLNGREYGMEISKAEEAIAKESGLVVVYGASDDLMEFCGAIYDEAGVYEGGTVCIDKDGLIDTDPACSECQYRKAEENNAKKIKALWCRGFAPWTYETDIPHVTFNIYEDGELYCVGIVFSVEDLQ